MVDKEDDNIEKNFIFDKRQEEDGTTRFSIQAHLNTTTFNHSKFDKELFDGILEEKDYVSILRNASKTISEAYCYKKNYDVISIPSSMNYLASATMLCGLIYGFFLYMSFLYEDWKVLGLTLCIISIAISFFVGVSLSIFNFMRKLKEFKLLNDLINNKMAVYVGEVNNLYSSFRFEFEMGESNYASSVHKVKRIVPIITFVIQKNSVPQSSSRQERPSERGQMLEPSLRNFRGSTNERYQEDEQVNI